MPHENWNFLSNGDIAVQPLTGWETAFLPQNLFVRLEYDEPDPTTESHSPKAVQIAMPAAAARKLAADLIEGVDLLDSKPSGTKQ